MTCVSSLHYQVCILSSVASPALHHFSTLSHKVNGFREKVAEYKMFVLILSTTLIRNISDLKRVLRDTVVHVRRSSYKVPVILIRF
jgi:hypothetical protein